MRNPRISITDISILTTLNHLAEIFSQDLDPQELMAVSVQEFRNIFDSDRAWLIYPCDPNTPECRVYYEATRPEYPGLSQVESRLEVSPGVAELFHDVLASDKPIVQPQGTGKQYDPEIVAKFSIQSRMSVALKMQNDRPWLLGLHQCSYIRQWSEIEIALFQHAGLRLCEAYNSRTILKTIRRDIVKRQKVETELSRSEQRFRSFFQHSSVSLWLLDISKLINCLMELRTSGVVDLNKYFEEHPDYFSYLLKVLQVVDVNRATLKFFESGDKEKLISKIYLLYTEKTLDALKSFFLSLFSGQVHVSLETEYRTLKENLVDAIINVDVLPGDDFLALVSIVDISQQKLLETTLRESREQYKELLETANDAILVTDVDTGLIVQANRKAEKLTGHSKSELIGMHQSKLNPANEWTDVGICIHPSKKGLNDKQDIAESFLLRADGQQIPVEISTSNNLVGGRRIVQSIFRDLRGRIEGEEHRRLLATAIEQSDDLIVITDTAERISYVNPAFERVTGYTLPEVVGNTPHILRSGLHDKSHYKMMWDCLAEGRVWYGNFINRKKDGSLYEEEASITPVKDHAGQVKNYVAVKRDKTKQISLEKQVRQAQKMQAIGTLAGGIAHDFNNILTAIMGFAELSLLHCENNQLLESNIQEVIRGAERAGKLINQILTFSRQTEKNVTALRLSIVIKETLKLLRASLPANIEIIQNIDPEVMVRADPTQMHQVVMNLFTNAYQAIFTDKGWIKVSLKSVHIAGKEGVVIGNLSRGKYVCLMVEDNGCGVSSEMLGRIFEPYFTTREKNEGTGLGLSVVHGIVNDHGGAVTVDSTIGEGSCFTVYLPEVSSLESMEAQPNMELLTGKGRVLIVDDEQQIVDYEMEVLRRAGYEPDGFTNSQAALDALLAKPDGYDLVITDMAMPDMTGLQLFRKIRKEFDDLPVLLCTGYSEHVTAESSVEMGINGYLAKPFTADQFAEEVKKIIASDER